MNYEIIETTDTAGNVNLFIKLITGKNSYKSFATENENKDYISFLRQLSEENPEDPHFVAWVEAGNNPEDFWTQDEALLTEGEEE